jgi:hypothetical protein
MFVSSSACYNSRIAERIFIKFYVGKGMEETTLKN